MSDLALPRLASLTSISSLTLALHRLARPRIAPLRSPRLTPPRLGEPRLASLASALANRAPVVASSIQRLQQKGSRRRIPHRFFRVQPGFTQGGLTGVSPIVNNKLTSGQKNMGDKTKYEPAKPQKAINNSLLASTLFSRGASLAQGSIAIIIRLYAGTRLPEGKPGRLLLGGRIWVYPRPPRPFPIELQSPPRLMRGNSWLGFRVTSLCGGILG